MTEPLHRDDLPMETAEEIVKALKEKHPGYQVQFAGDSNFPEAKQIAEQLMEEIKRKRDAGLCSDCGKEMPNWPPDGPEWRPPEDWSVYTDPKTDEPMLWICPECEKEEGEE